MERSVRARVVRNCNPETIEADLESLWRELANQTPAARAIMSNLPSQIPATRETPIRVQLHHHPRDAQGLGSSPAGWALSLS